MASIEEQLAATTLEDDERDFRHGEEVILHSLKAEHMNGKRGRVVGYVDKDARYNIDLGFVNGDLKNIKPVNLQRVPRDESLFRVGDLVALQGLGDLDGKHGWITGRQMHGSSQVLVHGTNCDALDAPELVVPMEKLKRVETSSGIQSVVCRPFVKIPSTYGNQPALELPRLATLPRKNYGIHDPKAEKVFMELYQGKFAAGWHYSDGPKPFEGLFDMYVACLDDDTKTPLPGIVMMLSIGGSMQNGNAIQTLGGHNARNYHQVFSQSVPDRAKEDLAFRLHLEFFRQQGASLPLDVQQFLGYHLPIMYAQHKKNQKIEIVDLAVAVADCVDQVEPHQNSAFVLVKVGEEMEAKRKFKEAANVYIQAAAFCRVKTDMKWRIEEYVGVALRRANELHQAEKWYIRALHHQMACNGDRLDIHERDTSELLENFIYVYTCMRERRQERFFAQNDETMEPLLAGLLFSAGWKPAKPWCKQLIQKSGRNFQALLKEEFRNQIGALRVLKQSLQTGAVGHFRQELLSCLNTPVSMVGGQQDVDPEQSKHDAQVAKNHKSASQAGRSNIRVCADPDCGMVRLRVAFVQCPCASVNYCAKDCQAAHWKVHKKFCAYQKEKEKSKKEQNSSGQKTKKKDQKPRDSAQICEHPGLL